MGHDGTLDRKLGYTTECEIVLRYGKKKQAGETTQNLDPFLCSSRTVHAYITYNSIHTVEVGGCSRLVPCTAVLPATPAPASPSRDKKSLTVAGTGQC
ncbi:hypothetical protein V496_08317 [Pseudogymnoascus sp. VKM F-4515 (FW-2607)]|nr:hypothetical protein V496_08317 [Pseudogymnoascus sp. VKM F-4515 (FW-2607)]